MNTFLAIYFYLLVEGRYESSECLVPTELTGWEVDAQCNGWDVGASSARRFPVLECYLLLS